MRHYGPASEYERWFDAYEVAFGLRGATGGISCPHCQAPDLVLRFLATSSASNSAVMPAVWCAACLHGMAPVRAVLPDWAQLEANPHAIPDYAIVADQ